MTRNFILLCFALISITLASCEPDYVKAGKRQIDSLDTQYQQLQTSIKEFKYEEAMEKLETVEEHLEHFQASNQDTLSRDEAMLLSNYHSVAEPLEKLKERYQYYQDELQTTRKQLDGLRHDLENKAFTDSLFQVYLSDERNALNRLQQEASQAVEMAKKKMVVFDSLQPRITRLAKSVNIEVENEKDEK
ncbi:MAG: hypothetical protein H6585_12775 [Flavobacteriales bacterium]|nr:hypothetical protein [Flavobacteriales bacterium]MCB9449205.1 hypothetical protein [Flavobacteriales bacterium]